jgi:putative phosphoesterase
MRIAVVSDIHGNLPALEAVVRDFADRDVDRVVNLGDSLSGPLLPLETAQFLMGQDWVHLAGNHERQVLTGGPGQWNASDEFTHSQLSSVELAWIASLKPNAQLNRDVFLCHATPNSDVEYFLETVEVTNVRVATLREVDSRLGDIDASLILCGHTHVSRSMRSSKGQLIVNPGSVGMPAYDDIDPAPHAIETGSPDARYAIVERVADTWRSSLIAVPYAHMSMAMLAHQRKRDDWARALATGYVSCGGGFPC